MRRVRHLGLLLAWSAIVLLAAGKFNTVVEIGGAAPVFKNLPGINGATHSLSDYKEDVVVIVFLANHCPWVRGGEKDLIKLVAEFKGQNVRFIGIGVNLRQDDTLPAMKKHAAQAGYNFDYLHDPTQEMGRKFGATRTPEFFVLNKERRIVYMGLLSNSQALAEKDGSVRYTNGDPKDFYVRDAVKAALAGKAAPTPETRAVGCTVEYASR